ncbi:TPA: hypothetical protein L3701_002608 [Pseudomonas aeruginosa]|nr:hypothetical protein [Pseudomonas aeruginosa]
MTSQYENIIGMRKKIDAQADHIRRLEIRIHELRTVQAQHSVPELLVRAEGFVSGFEDDDEQEGVSQLLADLRLAIGRAK